MSSAVSFSSSEGEWVNAAFLSGGGVERCCAKNRITAGNITFVVLGVWVREKDECAALAMVSASVDCF